MITTSDLLLPDLRLQDVTVQPETDPLTEEDALQEAQPLDVRFDALRSTVGLLFELRFALNLRRGNTGVLVARGVRELSWTTDSRSGSRTAWTVGGSLPSSKGGSFGLELGLWPGAQLTLIAETASFFAGDVSGVEWVPDYTSGDEATVRAQTAGWHSEFTPVTAAYLPST